MDRELMDQWLELVQIAGSIHLSNDEDAIIWQYESKGRYSVQSLYAVVNNRGVQQVFTPLVWKIQVPPRLHIFFWLLANGKVLTRDNLAKRRHVEDKTCLFCNEAKPMSMSSMIVVWQKCCGKECWRSLVYPWSPPLRIWLIVG
jgi:hypothetical protein